MISPLPITGLSSPTIMSPWGPHFWSQKKDGSSALCRTRKPVILQHDKNQWGDLKSSWRQGFNKDSNLRIPTVVYTQKSQQRRSTLCTFFFFVAYFKRFRSTGHDGTFSQIVQPINQPGVPFASPLCVYLI